MQEENHQENKNEIVRSIDDLREVIISNDGLGNLVRPIEELKEKFEENTSEVRKLAELIQQEKKEKKIERPFEMLFIPSRGLFYPSKENYLLLNQLTYIEESLLTSEFLVESGKAMEFLLKNILVEQNIEPTDLLTGDVQAISLFLRSFAYGDNVDIEFDCNHCGFSEEVSFRLSSFQMKDLIVAPENGEIPMMLDGTDLIFSFKPLTYFEETSMIKAKISNLDKIIYMTQSINGCTDRRVIEGVLKNLTIQQIRRLKKFLDRAIPGIDAQVRNTCSSCGKDNVYSFNGIHTFLSFPPSFLKSVREELFLVSYYGKGMDLETVKRMPVTERRWFLDRINEELTKKREAEEKEMRKAKAKGKMRRK